MDNAIENYTKLGVDKIKDVDILEKKDFDIINNLSAELQRVFQVKQIWRTENEMRFAVLDDTNYPTSSSKYWQCIREQDVFFTQLILTSCEYQILQGELELLEIEYDEIQTDTKKSKALRKIKDGEIKSKKFRLMTLRLEAHDRVREVELWEKLKNEQMKKADFNINDVNAHQYETFKIKWQKQMELAQQSGHHDLFRNAKQNLDTLRNLEDPKIDN